MDAKKLFNSVALLAFIILLAFIQAIHSPFSFITETHYLSEPYDQKGLIKGGLYLISYLISLVALASILFIANRWIAYPLIIVATLIFSLDLFVQLLGSSTNGITVALLSTAFNEAGRISDLLVYQQPLLYAVLAAIVLFSIAYGIRQLIPIHNQIKSIGSLSLLAITMLVIAALSYKIFSIKTQAYPAPIKASLILGEYFAHYRSAPQRELDKKITPVKAASYQTIIWIIDESISGNYLSINGYHQANTPFLNTLQTQTTMQNYGVVAPISNCSNTSNLLLRIGLTSAVQQDFKTAKNSLPTIFQYAKQAGFTTYLIDAQIAPGEMQNNLTGQDLKFIDHNLAFPRSIHPQDRDQTLLTELERLLTTQAPQPQFIVAVKWGAHWPYSLAYPKQQTLFTPAATESLTEMSTKNQEIITNSYLNALHYSVDYFLQGLLAKPLMEDQMIFYTSDHGQSLFEHAHSPLTHCHYASDPQQLPLGEFKVPLMVFAAEAKTQFPKLANRLYAQEQIFPSTLQLFGYDQTVYQAYGPTLQQGSRLDYAQSWVLDSGLGLKIPKAEFQ
ncbi:MAG: hypothetical protein RLZZ215_488 [Pseudomonadota bacterium]|jgi:glucan phosphoethanolaminetransferase (alkaline phosphatase superfamily)